MNTCNSLRLILASRKCLIRVSNCDVHPFSYRHLREWGRLSLLALGLVFEAHEV